MELEGEEEGGGVEQVGEEFSLGSSRFPVSLFLALINRRMSILLSRWTGPRMPQR